MILYPCLFQEISTPGSLLISDADDPSLGGSQLGGILLDETTSTTTEASTEAKLGFLLENMDGFFLIVMGCIVFLMQCGFAFLEAGSVRYACSRME